jgi:transcriptional regulator with XRE-family HTH domain
VKFGELIVAGRRQANLSQKGLADRIHKADGAPISGAYLHDIEQDRRNPPRDELIEQFAVALHLPREVLYFAAGRIPPELCDAVSDADTIVNAFAAFSRILHGE